MFCPSSPLVASGDLVGDVPEIEPVRAATLDAVSRLVADGPARVVVVGAGSTAAAADERAGGSLAQHGLDVTAGGPELGLDLAHTIGAWLLDRVGWTGARAYVDALRPQDLDDAAVLVVADGSAKRSERAPGHLDDRAAPFDATVAVALADGDPDALGGIDLALADELWCSGAPVWRSVGDAVAVRAHRGGGADDEVMPTLDLTATVLHDDAPLGVGWFVAEWDVP